jgi:hypothetical protein
LNINAKYDASYRNAQNTNRMLGRALTLGQACGINGVALFGADIPLEDAGDYSPHHVYFHFTYFAYLELSMSVMLMRVCVLRFRRLHGHFAAVWYSFTDEELAEILSCINIPVLTAYIDCVFSMALRLWKFIMPREAEARGCLPGGRFSSCFS